MTDIKNMTGKEIAEQFVVDTITGTPGNRLYYFKWGERTILLITHRGKVICRQNRPRLLFFLNEDQIEGFEFLLFPERLDL